MKKLPLLLLLIAVSAFTFAQSDAKKPKKIELPSFIKLDQNISSTQRNAFFNEVFQMSDKDALRIVQTTLDEIGFTHEKFQQYFNGVKVEGATYSTHSKNGKIETMTGNFIRIADLNVQPTISENNALQAALTHVNADIYMWESHSNGDHFNYELPRGELLIVGDVKGLEAAQLAYKFDIYAEKPLYRSYVYINAQTGNFITEISQLCNANVAGNGNSLYNGNVSFTCDNYSGSSHRLRQTADGNGVQTFDLNNGTDYNAAVDIVSNSSTFTNEQTGVQAHYGAERTHKYYMQNHARNSFDNNGAIIKSYVSYSTNYVNAFWNGSVMTYGDGDGVNYSPLVSLDIVGHEITHGVTSYSSNLAYQRESGALNESFSDIFGEAIENYAVGSNNWQMGTEIGIGGSGAFRSMNNPNSYGDPDTYAGSFWSNPNCGTPTQSNDYCGVHTNSGVQNKWFYILSIGETGTNDIGSNYNVSGIGITNAARVAYRNLTVYLSSNSTFADARSGAIQAAIDLFGAGSAQVIATTNAWYAVGVGDQFGGTPPPTCIASPVVLTIKLDNYPEETSWLLTNNGVTVASGGTYGALPDGSTVTQTFNLSPGSYIFRINDSYGDGICCGYGTGYYTLVSGTTTIRSGGAFGTTEVTNFCIQVLDPCANSGGDSDNDGICDNVDQCPGQDDALIGTTCNDGNVCTIGDVYNSNCGCAGTFQDSDSDGVCDANDQCPNFDDALIGTTCNDGNACTSGDIYNANCGCSGTFQDSDSDGVCDANDQCPNFDDALIGTACNDGNVCTTGDIYNANCGCSGTFQDSDSDGVCDANDQCPNFDDALIGTACNDGNVCTTGDIYNANCGCSGTFQDSDSDGVCDANDQCPNFDDALIGTTCNDGNVCTTGDIYNANCGCSGTFQDSDSDGICDANDQCPNFDDALIGTSCNDGNACTVGETYDTNCGCSGGIFQDSDSDGICDANDQCPNFDDALIGTTCNDGNACTSGDVYNSNCGCSGTFQDSDSDGICDANDQCPNFDDALIGTACSDGNACTVGETYDTNCGCSGGIFQDSDNDGVCNANDQCPNFDDSLIGTSCNDGNSCTTGDVYTTNCGCEGTPNADSDGDGVCDVNDQCPNFNDALIGTACSDGYACTVGETYDTNCGCSGGIFQDSDGDGVCDANDICPNFDDALIGTSCNDGNACTTGDVYNSNCGCSGVFQDADNDGVCDANDQCPNFNDALIGTACSDGNACTVGETYDTNCSCSGGIFQDSDGDGVCDANDICPNFDDALIGTSCNDGNVCTSGDVYNSNCGCSGVFQDADNDGVCDANDQCPNFNDALIGTACNDNNACTTGDVYDSNCGCSGVFQDTDSDGVCDANDQCPNFDDALIGTACNDNNACTSGDVYNSNCGCSGVFQDADSDGVCDANDQCPNFNDALIGTACNDNNSCTTGDVYNSNCGCSGVFQDADNDEVCDANDQCPNFDDALIGTSCNDDNACTTGDVYNSNCGCTGVFQDADSDGVCDANDQCPGTNDALIGTACNDNNVCTINDLYSNSCVCIGTFADTDGDGVCNANDICPNGDDNVDTNHNGIPDACESICTYATINFNNFDSNWGIWSDGGSDCQRNTSDAAYANSGTYCVRLRDNTNTSVMTTSNLNLASYSELTVNLSFITNSMESNEDFWLQISTNGGGTYTTVKDWNRGIEFNNNQRLNPSVVIAGPFTSTTRLRFRCDASDDGDNVYIDDVRIQGCSLVAGILSGGSVPEDVKPTKGETEVANLLENDIKLLIYPNPARDFLNVVTRLKVKSFIIYNVNGILVEEIKITGEIQPINIAEYTPGSYFVVMETEDEVLYRKFIKF